jgi:hypothetical protein
MLYNENSMTNLHKAFWHSEKDSITLSMPIAKIDKERRTVSGFATLDNVDKQSDVVPAEVSIKAFERFKGNIREMHMPIAVGKMISFKSDKYYDKEEDKFYNGIYVDAYISKGAQDTWEKVLDGTLTGFSIGGNIKDSDKGYKDDMEKEIRVIKEYELHELSLVDNPANQFANILSIQKTEGGENKYEGIMLKTIFENVYYSKEDRTIRLSKEEDPRNDETWIGFVESNDIDKASVIKGLIKSQDENLTKEGSNMKSKKEATVVAEEKVEKTVEAEQEIVTVDEIVKSDSSEEVAEEAPAEEAPAEEAPAIEAPAEEAPAEEAPAEEAPAEEAPAEEAIAKSEEVSEIVENAEITEQAASVEENVQTDMAKAVETVQASVEEVSKSVITAVEELAASIKTISDQVAEITKSIASVKEEVTEVKGNVDEFGKRIDSVEDDTAVRKSGDLGGVVHEKRTKKSMWGGRFLNSADLYR